MTDWRRRAVLFTAMLIGVIGLRYLLLYVVAITRHIPEDADGLGALANQVHPWLMIAVVVLWWPGSLTIAESQGDTVAWFAWAFGSAIWALALYGSWLGIRRLRRKRLGT